MSATIAKLASGDLLTVDPSTVLKGLAGGAAVGGGGAALMFYLKHLADVQARAEAKQKALEEPEIYARPVKQAVSDPNDVNTAGTFIATTGALGLGGYGAYKLIQKIYEKQRAKQDAQDMTQAQHDYLQTLVDSRRLSKQASGSQFTLPTWGAGAGGLLLLLTALGAGTGAYQYLKRKNPVYNPPGEEENRTPPLKLDLPTVARKVGPEDPSDGAQGKWASTAANLPTSAQESELLEAFLRLALADKRAAYRDASVEDLVCAVAAGRASELRSLAQEGGVDALFDATKGARHLKSASPSINRDLAIRLLAQDPYLSQAIAPVVIAECHELSPSMFKLAQYVPEEFQEDLTRLFAATARVARMAALEPLTKAAGAKEAGMEELLLFPHSASAAFFEELLQPLDEAA